MARLLAPILTFHLRGSLAAFARKFQDRVESVHMAMFPDAADILGGASVAESDPQMAQDWTTLLRCREQVLKALEEARNSKVDRQEAWKRR